MCRTSERGTLKLRDRANGPSLGTTSGTDGTCPCAGGPSCNPVLPPQAPPLAPLGPVWDAGVARQDKVGRPFQDFLRAHRHAASPAVGQWAIDRPKLLRLGPCHIRRAPLGRAVLRRKPPGRPGPPASVWGRAPAPPQKGQREGPSGLPRPSPGVCQGPLGTGNATANLEGRHCQAELLERRRGE